METPVQSTTGNSLPDIDCVIIGVNTVMTLERCLLSVKDSSYPSEKLHIVYVDGGSSDGSIAAAEAVADVAVVSLKDAHPTPGRGRNAGWHIASSPLVQFLDSDTVMEPDWLEQAVTAMADEQVGAVMGYRKEMHPDRTVYNWITSLEWNGPPGEADSFGGDVLVRRQILEETGGYDEVMVGGEDPELSQRVRQAGWKILQLDAVMTYHDIAMTTAGQYWKRAYRSGYGFAAVIDKTAGQNQGFWRQEFRRILVRGGGFLLLSLFALLCCLAGFLLHPLFFAVAAGSLLLGLVLLFFPRLFRVKSFMTTKGLTLEQARIYALHCSCVILPDILGVSRYYFGRFFNRPLRNNPSSLKSRKT